jgi:hypothetical protein
MNSLLYPFIALISILGLKTPPVNYTEYYKLVNFAKDQRDSSNFQSAANLFSQAFSTIDTPFPKDLISAAKTEYSLAHHTKSIDYLKKAAAIGLIPADSFLLKLSLNQPGLPKELAAIKDLLEQSHNRTYCALVDSLFLADQAARHSGTIRTTMKQIDSSNTYCLLNYMTTHGFPSYKILGIENADKAFLIFLHADFDANNKILGNILYQAVLHGDFEPVHYAELCDRRNNFSGKPPMYYQIPFGYDQLSQIQKDSITTLRAAIGLRSVEKTIEYKFTANGNLQTRLRD